MICPYRKITQRELIKFPERSEITLERFPECQGKECPFHGSSQGHDICVRAAVETGIILKAEDV